MSTGEQTAPGGQEEITAAGSAAKLDTTGIAAPPEERLELPPLPAPPPVVAVNPLRGRRLDGVLCLLLLVFAFLCGSFTARNPDLFQSLATGRLIAQGKYTFGSDPFSFASTGTWVNHAWLFDVLAYGLFQIGAGGVVLGVVKALFVVALAWVMLRAASAPGERLWLPIVCTTLGVLALSPRLWLQPGTVSLVLLALTLLIFTQSSTRPGRLWLLPVICLFWVNLDVWFLLGPITLLAYALGQQIPALAGPATADAPASPRVPPKTFGLVFLVSIAACLCNPHHVKAFTEFPTGLFRFAAIQTLGNDGMFRGFFLSPFLDYEVYFRDTFGLSVAGVSYFVLLGLSLASFVAIGILHRQAFRWDRLLVWIVFALLSAMHIRAIPFFAVVAAPIMGLNFFDLLLRPVSSEGPARNVWAAWAIPGRVFTLLGLLGLCVGSISGAIQAQPHYRREFGWGVEVDKGLAGAARQIVAWQEAGLIPAGQNWMTLSPETVNYLAWFAPGEKGFVDQRLTLFGEAGEEYGKFRRSLAGEQTPGEAATRLPTPDWRTSFRDRKIPFFIFHNSDLSRVSSTLLRLYATPKEFVPCYMEGDTAIFAWRDPEDKNAPGVDPRLVIDFNARAFGPRAEAAPPTSGREPGMRPWWWPILRAEDPSPPETWLAFQYSTRFDALTAKTGFDNDLAWASASAAGVMGFGAAPGGPLPGGILLRMRFYMTYDLVLRGRFNPGLMQKLDMAAQVERYRFIRQLDEGPAADLYLAIRASRRSLAENPDDTLTQLVLAESYSRLNMRTREKSRFMALAADQRELVFFSFVQLIRQTQIAAALRNVLKVNPSPERARVAHLLLAEVFREPQYLEPRVYHLREFLRLSKALGSLPRVSPAAFEKELKDQEARVKDMERQLKSKRDQYEVNAGNKPLMQKVRIAIENGLAETALNLLLKASASDLRSDKSQRESPGATIAITLLLGLGRVEDVEQALAPDLSGDQTFDPRAFGTHMLGLPAYEWFQVQKSAATGDYAAADRYLEECLKLLRRSPDTGLLEQLGLAPRTLFPKELDRSAIAGLVVGEVLLCEGQRAAQFPWQLSRMVRYRPLVKRWDTLNYPPATFAVARGAFFRVQAQEANVLTVRAWLALEAGSIDKARQYATQALDLAYPAGYDPQIYSTFLSVPLASLVQELTHTARERK